MEDECYFRSNNEEIGDWVRSNEHEAVMSFSLGHNEKEIQKDVMSSPLHYSNREMYYIQC